MRDDEIQIRISRIETVWTSIRKAHAADDSQNAEALEVLLLRYRRAVYVYLLGILRDADAADEVFQEFALRVIKGAFRNAVPEKGRFRNLVKATLANLVVDHRRKQNRQPIALEGEGELPANPDEAFAAQDEEFVRQWRDEVMARTWDALAQEDQQNGQIYFAVLQYRAEHAETSSEEIAQALAGVRQTLKRARERFAQLLVAEVSRSLSAPDRLEAELEELGLLSYCQSALQRE
jgi:RNA polymerase sigma-70 factor (ECF subfamily)